MNTCLNVYIMIIITAIIARLTDAIGVTIVPSGVVVRRVNDNLNLTCKVKTEDEDGNQKYSLAWNLPLKHGSEKSRVTIYKGFNELTVTIHQLQKEDSGQYSCEIIGDELSWKHNVEVSVRAGKEKCADTLFSCGRGICILRRFACDGFPDCPNKADETVEECGENPCSGKILCDDGRCISKQLCCDHSVDVDCSVWHTVPCCFKVLNKETGSSETPIQLHRYSDINFLQSTIYTIVSCAIAFIFITTIMVVAICRIHMRRSVMSFHSQRIRTSGNRRQYTWPWYFSRLQRRENTNSPNHWQGRFQILYPNSENEEALLHSNQARTQIVPYSCSLSAHGSFIVTYSDPDGVQLVEHLPKPPPYTEASDTSMHLCPFSASGVPPPPYSSVEQLPSYNGSETTLSPPEISSVENDQMIIVHTTPNVPSVRTEDSSQSQA